MSYHSCNVRHRNLQAATYYAD